MSTGGITARCYCGQVSLSTSKAPITVAFCHCSDCQRWTGSPAPAFAAFDPKDLTAEPAFGAGVVTNPGVERWNCTHCGSPLAARFDYLPEQIYIPLGLIDQAADLPAQIHCHSESVLPWLHIHDNAERAIGTGRDALLGAQK